MVRRISILGFTFLLAVSIPVLAGDTQRGYRDYAQLQEAVAALALEYPDHCSIASIGTSYEGRQIPVITITGHADDAETGSALLIVANLEAAYWAGSEAVLNMSRTILERLAAGDESAREVLRRHRLYLVPRVNVDGAEYVLKRGVPEFSTNLQPNDADRDRQQDEDGVEDINGDGVIVSMRVYDPEKADHLADPADPRINLEADPVKGLAPEFYLRTEGIDNDGDGLYNEDGYGGVNINRNFMHGWDAYQTESGLFPGSAPEALALLEFTLSHQEIAAVIQYGPDDNIVSVPKSRDRNPVGVPRFLDEKDIPYYEFLSEFYREITGQKKSETCQPDGAFFAWAYAQFGVPSFAIDFWTRPDVPEKSEPEEAQEDEAPAAEDEEPAAEVEEPAGDPEPAHPEVLDKEEAAWLAYAEQECDGGEGFIPWREFQHPSLGRVEIGGWLAGYRENPPISEMADIAEKQAEFAIGLLDRLPRVRLEEPQYKALSAGLYEIKIGVVNDGYLPVATARGVANRRVRPLVLRLSLPPERILEGRPVVKIWNVPGSGGRETVRWLVECGESEVVEVELFSEKFGRESKAFQPGAAATQQPGVQDAQ